MAVEWEAYLREVMPDVAGCPIRVAENAVRNAAITFLEETRLWREPLTDTTTVEGQDDYTIGVSAGSPDIVIPDESQLLGIHKLLLGDDERALNTLNVGQLDQFPVYSQNQRPRAYYSKNTESVTLWPTPDGGDYNVRTWAILTPTRDATGAPDWLHTDWLEAIACGAKYRLLMMAGRSWANPKFAPAHRRQFRDGIVTARIRDTKSHVQQSSNASFATFGFYRGSRV